MCAISINNSGFKGELRFPLGFTTPAQKPLASQKTTNVWRSVKDRGATQRHFCTAFQTALAGDVCHLQRDCNRGRSGSRLGAGSQDPAVPSTAFPSAGDSSHENSGGRANPRCYISSSPVSDLLMYYSAHILSCRSGDPLWIISCYG